MKKLISSAIGAAAYLSLAIPAFANAGSVNPCPTGGFSKLCGLNAGSFGKIVQVVITVLLIIATVIALFFLIWGGIRWITSGGDKQKVESARNTIISAVIGLVIAFLAYFILTVILGLFGLNAGALTLPTLL